MANRLSRRSKLLRILIPLLLLLSWFIPLPYYVYEPGSAEELQPIISVADGQKDEKGSLMLTTVLTAPVRNIYYLGYGTLMPNREIVPKNDVERGMSDEEYTKLLQHMMSNSQESSIVAAMRYMNLPVNIKYLGVVVSGIAPYSKVKQVLEVGDLIEKIDDRPMDKRESIVTYLQTKRAGDKVQIQYLRGTEQKTSDVELVQLLDENGKPMVPNRVGIGIDLMTKQKAENLIKVDFHTEEIGGPSAGMMFALEIISQKTPGDLTKGHKIAGTGTIDGEGNVGQIGGIQHKIVAAQEQEAEIFFTPADINPGDMNTKIAREKATEIGSTMKIVPVRKLSDAVEYLKNLP